VSAQRPSSRALGRKAGDRSRRHATRRETGSRRQGGILRARARALRADLPDAAFVRTPWIETIATDREWPRRTRDAVAGGGEAGARVHSPRKTAGVPRAGACGRRRPARRGWQILAPSDFEIPSTSESTTWSTFLVETPTTYASWTTETSAAPNASAARGRTGSSCRGEAWASPARGSHARVCHAREW
jgi:hypothetical protein